MNVTLLKGYPDFIGKRAAWAGYGSGPASYVAGGDSLNLPLANYYIDTVEGPLTSVSGNYLVYPVPSGVGPRQSWKLKWVPSAESQGAAAGAPLVLGPLSVAATASAYVAATTTTTCTVTGANTLSAGNFIVLSSGTTAKSICLCGPIVQVTVASPTQYSFNFGQGTALAYASGADVVKYQLVQVGTGNPLQAQPLAAPITGVLATTALLTITQANSLQVGQFVLLNGPFKAASLYASGAIVQVASATAAGWTANWQGTVIAQTAAEVGVSSLLVTNSGAPVTTGQFSTVTNSLAVASAAAATGLLTMTASNTFVPTDLVVLQGLATRTALNGTIGNVIASGLATTAVPFQGWTIVGATTAEASGTVAQLVAGVPVGSGEVLAGTNLSGEQIQLGGFCGQY